MNERMSIYLLALGIVIIVAAFVPASFWGGTADRFGRWIYDYQTLISGLLAIFAAVITISQIRSSDRRADARTRKQIFLERRAEMRRIGRFVSAFTASLMSLSKMAAGVKPVTVWTDPMRNAYWETIRLAHKLKSEFEAVDPKDTELFDVELHQQFKSVESLTTMLCTIDPEPTSWLRELYRGSMGDSVPDYYTEQGQQVIDMLGHQSAELSNSLWEWRQTLYNEVFA